ncbi:MAG: DNA/RNA nuclease SfsA [Rhodospirillales bacterium]|nr:DNA/RNA nuclease SfsA [Rhodospirillales bacterium]
MRFETPLIPGTLVRRYKRFLADVILDSGEAVIAHCPNSGSMLSVDRPGSEVWLSRSPNAKRKLPLTWELVRVGGALVGINTGRPNSLVAEGIAAGSIPELSGYASLRREVRYGRNSRIDLLLESDDRPPCYVEIKNVTLRRGGGASPAEFPDAVTARGAKHLAELTAVAAAGGRAVMLYLIQRPDADRFELARDIDPAYGRAFLTAREHGVEMLCYGCSVSIEGIYLDRVIDMCDGSRNRGLRRGEPGGVED